MSFKPKSDLMKKLLMCAAVILVPTLASADRMERFEAISAQMNDLMAEMMANEIDQQGGDGDIIRAAAPEQIFDDETTAATECLLDRYILELGDDAVDAMLDRMEGAIPQMADMSMTEFSESEVADALSPPGLSEHEVFDISQDCGLMAIQVKRMQESGFMEAFMAASESIPDSN